MKRKFWNWIRNEDESVPDMERTLFLNGMISDETWYGDEVTPQLFKDELNAGNGNITVWINSPGGDVFAAAQIYNMLRDYKGSVTVKIDGIAASAASVAKNRNFDRNRARGCNYGLEGGCIFDYRGVQPRL